MINPKSEYQDLLCRLESIGTACCVLDEHAVVLDGNNLFLSIFNFRHSEVIGHSFTKFLVPHNVSYFQKIFAGIETLCVTEQIYFEIISKEGTIKTLSFFGIAGNHPVSEHMKIITCTMQDISRIIKESEKQTLVANERLQYLLSSTPAVIYTAKVEGNFGATFISNNVTQITGHRPSDYLADFEFWIKQVHPEDTDYVLKQMKRTLDFGSNSFEYRYRHIDGHYIWIRDETKLVLGNNGMPVEIVGYWADTTDRKIVQQELERSHLELRKLYRHAQVIREAERRSIAREIHDEIGQGLTTLNWDLNLLRDKMTSNGTSLTKSFNRICARLSEILQTVQTISTKLRPETLDDLGIIAAMRYEASEFQKRTKINCHFTLESVIPTLNKGRSINLFRIFQEALTNIACHSQATTVDIAFYIKDEHIIMKINDNGKGISQDQLNSAKSIGIIGMKERATYCGGSMQIEGIKNHGTIISVTIPFTKGKKHVESSRHR